ncbi:rhodanese-like domain-containing protein [Anaerocolumna jejuensis]|uniref:rhodanese-like domain-containing protein n=1 Tax=Anaerocolumna jejuensis TaxID=259063 RepID=UPI003F7BA945
MLDFLKKTEVTSIHVNDMDNLIGKVELIDIREPYEYNRGSIRTAKNIPMDKLLGTPDKFMDKEKEYYIICQSGGRSMAAAKALTRAGYRVVNVAGGVGSYVGTKRS